MKNNSFRKGILFLLSFLWFVFAAPIAIYCQKYSFREYGVRDGLPQSQAHILFQDSRGFIWISTLNGLSRFDGVDFINYHLEDGLPHNMVLSVFEDESGILWALTYMGLSEYTGNGFRFYPPGNEFLNSRFNGIVYAAGKPGSAYFLSGQYGSSPGRIIFFDSGSYFDYSAKYPALDTFMIRDMLFNRSSDEFLLTDEFQQLWLWKNSNLKKLQLKDVNSLSFYKNKLFVKTGNINYEYDNGTLYPSNLDSIPGWPKACLANSGREIQVRFFPGESISIIKLSFKASSLDIDREGTIWLSSESSIYHLLSPAYQFWTKEEINLSDPWAICPDRNGNIWLGSLYSDLKMFDGTNFIDRNDYKKVIKRDLFFYKGSRLMSNGETLLSTNSCILIWDGSRFSKLDAIKEDVQVCYIYEDPDDHRIMAGTNKGLYTINNGEVSLNDQYVPDKLGVIEGIQKDEKGFYWMSGHNGLVRLYDTVSVKVIDKVLPDFFTFTVEKDKKGGIWVSSDQGLFYKGLNDSIFSVGLPAPFNKPVNVVSIVDESHLLIGRITDLCIIDLDKYYSGDKNYFRVYDKTDGYPGAESLDNGIIRGSDGVIWILTSENLVRLDQSLISENINPPLLHFTGMYFETDSQTWKPADRNEFYYGMNYEFKLGRDQNKIKITFTGISTGNPEKVMFQYQLKGADDKWSLPFERREVVFRDLQPGSYSFMLKGINADGYISSEPLILKFSIEKAYRETALFKVSLLILLVLITAFLTRFFIRKKHKINEEKQKLRSELLRLQMNSFLREFNSHFTFNAISSIGSLIMKNDRKAAYLYLTRLSSLMRVSLRESNAFIKPVSEELNFVRNYCELHKLRFGNRFSYSIQIGDDVNLTREIPKMTIQTFVENSIKHGIEKSKEGGEVEIKLLHIDNYLQIVVRDNGIGRSASNEIKTNGTGYGIKTIRRIFDLLNKNNNLKATLEILDLKEKNIPAGTLVVIKIPDDFIFRAEDMFVNHSDNDIQIDDSEM